MSVYGQYLFLAASAYCHLEIGILLRKIGNFEGACFQDPEVEKCVPCHLVTSLKFIGRAPA